LRYYELMMVVTPQVDEEGLSATLETVNRHIGECGGTVVRQQRWGTVRRLAYPIKSHREGSYVLTYLHLDPQNTGELEASLRVSEDILRHLLVKVDAIPELAEAQPRAGIVAEGSPVSPDSPVAGAQAVPVAEESEASLLVEDPPKRAGSG